MKKSRFTEEKMVKILREADRSPVQEVAKKHGVSDQTIYGWRKRFGQLEAVDVRRLRQLEQENAKLKKRKQWDGLLLTLRDGVNAPEWWRLPTIQKVRRSPR